MRAALLAALLLLAQPVAAEPVPPPSPPSLTLAVAFAAALDTHEDMAAAGASVDAARASLASSRSNLRPSASASAGAQASGSDFPGSSPISPTLSSSLSVSQDLLPLDAAARVAGARAGLDEARAGWDATRLDLLHAVAAAFYRALAAEETLAARRADVDLSIALLEGMEARVRLGAAIPLSVMRARVAVANARAGLAAAERDRQAACLALGRLVGFLPPAVSGLDIVEIPPPPEVMAAVPSVRQAQAAVEGARRDLEAARRGRLPSLSFSGSTGTSLSPLDDTAPSWSWQAGVNAGLTLYGGGSLTASIDSATASLRSAEASLAGAERDAAVAIETARAGRNAALAMVRAQEEALQAARDNLDGVRAMLNVGKATTLEVADAAATLAQAESHLIEARLDRDLATLAWYEALGLPPPGAPE